MKYKVMMIVVLIMGLSNLSYAARCGDKTTVVVSGHLRYLITDDLEASVSEAYLGGKDEKTAKDIMKLTIDNLGKAAVYVTCIKVAFKYGGIRYTSGKVRKINKSISGSLAGMDACAAVARRRGFFLQKENILPKNKVGSGRSPNGDLEVFYLYDNNSNTSYPFWVGGHDIFKYGSMATAVSDNMIRNAAAKCHLALDEAVKHRDSRLHRELLRNAPSYRNNKRQQRRFNGRPPVTVPPMLPPILAY